MTVIAPHPAAVRTVLPYRHLRWRAMVAGTLACVVPGLAVALTIGLTGGGRPAPAIALGVLVLLAGAALSQIAVRSRTELTDEGLVTHWTQGARVVTVRADRVAQAVVRTVLNPDGMTANQHLFLVDADGAGLFRMCDRWWRKSDLVAVARHFDVPLATEPEPVQLAELRRSVPAQLSWIERHAVAAQVLRVVVGFGVCLAVAALCVHAL